MLALGILALAACGDSPSDATSTGGLAQPAEAESLSGFFDEFAPGYAYVAEGPTGEPCADLAPNPEVASDFRFGKTATEWLEVEALSLEGIDDSGYLRTTVSLRGGGSRAVDNLIVGTEWMALFVLDSLSQGADIWVGVRDGISVTDVVQRERGQEDLAFALPCPAQEQGAQTLADLAAGLGEESAPALVQSIVDGTVQGEAVQAELTRMSAPREWDDLDPSLRSITDETPQDVLDQLEEVLIEVQVPEPWRGNSSAVLCSRTPVAWNECFSLASLEDIERPGGGVEMFAWVERIGPGSGALEFWVVNPDVDLAGPAALIGEVRLGLGETDERGLSAVVVITDNRPAGEYLADSSSVPAERPTISIVEPAG